MKILHVYEKPVPLEEAHASAGGGVHSYLRALCGGLEQRGCRIATVRFVRRGSEQERREGPHYVLGSSSIRPSPGTRRALEQVLEREAPDVVHLHSLFYAIGPGLLGWLARSAPVVCTLHEVSPLCFWRTRVMSSGRLCDRAVGLGCLTSGCYRVGGAGEPLPDLVRIAVHGGHLEAYRRLPLLIVPSRYLLEQLRINRFPLERVRVVPHPTPFAPAAPGPEADPGLVLFVGRLTAEKGVGVLLDALERLRAPRWQAAIVGDGALAGELARRIEAAGLGARVRLTGALDRAALADHYRAASLVVVPSIAPESFGLTGLEALAHARPVVAFPSGGVTEWLEDGVTGLLAARGDAGELAARIDRLLADPALRRRLGGNGAELVRRRFGLEAHLDRVLELYAERRAARAGTP